MQARPTKLPFILYLYRGFILLFFNIRNWNWINLNAASLVLGATEGLSQLPFFIVVPAVEY